MIALDAVLFLKVVYDDGDDETEIVLKGVVRAEKLPEPSDFVPAILSRVKEEYVRRLYGVSAWEDATDFMTKVAARWEKTTSPRRAVIYERS